jgi:hypothetical protein
MVNSYKIPSHLVSEVYEEQRILNEKWMRRRFKHKEEYQEFSYYQEGKYWIRTDGQILFPKGRLMGWGVPEDINVDT